MWHEQRREERRIKGMLVDRRRRAERRRDYYEKIKADRAAQGLPDLMSMNDLSTLNGTKKKKWKNNVSNYKKDLNYNSVIN